MAEKEELTAPFYMLTYGDMMTLLLTFFVLLFSMATIQEIKFESSVGAIKGSLGIMNAQSNVPIQQNLPAPSIKKAVRPVKKSSVKPTTLESLSDYEREDLTEPVQKDESSEIEKLRLIGFEQGVQISDNDEEIILRLPTFGVFGRGEYKINENAPEVKEAKGYYAKLAKQIAKFTEYDIYFVGHTDAINLTPEMGPDVPKTNMELGFLRAVALYDFFFQDYLTDKTKMTFASQGDNVPLIQNASLDSEKRKNRRVEIHLKKRPMKKKEWE